MKNVKYPNVDLNCILQKADEITEKECLVGVISRNEGQFKFEEAIRKPRNPRNPKLYDGRIVSMVRMLNGKYQFHMKTLPADVNREDFPFEVYTEIREALKILD